jgi:predicted nuclease of predicted toxin-antitoxin system
VRDLEATSASDSALLDLATSNGWTIISADTDFGALLAHRGATTPSVILVRELLGHRPDELATVIATHVIDIEDELTNGAIAAFTRRGVRVRRLPLR